MDFREVTEFFRDVLKYIIVIAIVLFLAIYVFSFQQIVGPSMQNTLVEDDIVIVNKLIYKISEIKRGDVVIVKKNDKFMVKRIVGLPSEYIEYKDNKLVIDGKTFVEDYTSSDTKDFSLKDLGYEIIGEDEYLVLGDNRMNSTDSRDYGLVSKKEIVGKASIRLFPFNSVKLIK